MLKWIRRRPSAETPAPEIVELVAEQAADTVDNDSPIRTPAQDRLGVDGIARTIARCIAGIGPAEEGTVIALNGPWGAGKSSVVNLTLHHLELVAGHRFETVPFNPWWFSGSNGLARSFFSTIGTVLNRTLVGGAKAAVTDFFGRLGALSTYRDAALKVTEDGWASGLAQVAFGEQSIEDAHNRLADELRKRGARILIVIDDIDRLSPDEALLMFGLVKSVGRLPGVTYLMAFDRVLVERLIDERFPSEGGQYLEKIVQASFDLPAPSANALHEIMLQHIGELFNVPDASAVRFMNMFYDVVSPKLTSPRHAVRLAGSLRVTWPAVAGEVDPADFVAIETIRMFHPVLYRNIRSSADLLCGPTEAEWSEAQQKVRERYEKAILSGVPDTDHPYALKALKRLFPRTQSIWGNMIYPPDREQRWERARLVCSSSHFPTYFYYSLDSDTVSVAVRDQLRDRAGDREFVQKALLDALEVPRKNGGTRAALLLQEYSASADLIAREAIEPFLAALFEIADTLDIAADKAGGFAFGDNQLRIHWITGGLLERLSIDERSALLVRIAPRGAASWLASLAARCLRPYRTDPEAKDDKEPETPWVTEDAGEAIAAVAAERVRAALGDGSLLDTDGAASALFFLAEVSPDGPGEVRQRTERLLDNDVFTVKLAGGLISTGWSQGGGFDDMGDRVARKYYRVHKKSLDKIVDPDRLIERVRALRAGTALSAEDQIIADRFVEAWDYPER